MTEDIEAVDAIEVVEGEEVNEVGLEKADDPKVYEEFRSYVRRLRCLACQKEKSPDTQLFDFTPGMENVSDPHHVVSVGAGGHDAENLVPLCRKHHSSITSPGNSQVNFQIKYNLDLKGIAVEVYQHFLNSDEIQEVSKKTFAYHKRIVSRIQEAKKAMMLVADEILEFVESQQMNKPAYYWLGFQNAESYFTASLANGGLGLTQRTAWRMLAMARVKEQLGGDDETARELGTYKCELVLPVIKDIEDPEEKKEIAQSIASMPIEDVISWNRNKLGKPDIRQIKHDKVCGIINKFLVNIGFNDVESCEEDVDDISWRILAACGKNTK